MAEKRMFSKKIVDSSRFYNLPGSARLLYYEIGMNCDDDGFCACADRLLRKVSGGKKALARLIEEGFLLDFGDVIVVRHWRIHNHLRNDRLRASSFPEVAEQLWLSVYGHYETEPGNGRMNLVEYHASYQKNGWDPLREMRGNYSENTESGWYSQKRREEEKRTEKNRAERKKAEISFDRLTDVERQTLDIIMGPGGLEEAVRQVGAVDGSLYEALMAWWKERGGYGGGARSVDG